ncbi:hypothetical protein [Profundibacter sp.]
MLGKLFGKLRWGRQSRGADIRPEVSEDKFLSFWLFDPIVAIRPYSFRMGTNGKAWYVDRSTPLITCSRLDGPEKIGQTIRKAAMHCRDLDALNLKLSGDELMEAAELKHLEMLEEIERLTGYRKAKLNKIGHGGDITFSKNSILIEFYIKDRGDLLFNNPDPNDPNDPRPVNLSPDCSDLELGQPIVDWIEGLPKFALVKKTKATKNREPLPHDNSGSAITGAGDPVIFGYKTAWLAIKSKDTQAICDSMQLVDCTAANWEKGVQTAIEGSGQRFPVYIAPPLAGWTLVPVGLNLVADNAQSTQQIETLVCKLSGAFGECQYFGSYRVVDYAAWFKAVDGEMVRGFSFADGEYHANFGKTTKAELDIGLGDISGLSIQELNSLAPFPDDPNGVTRWPNDDDPLLIAEKWSINPMKVNLVEDVEKGVGLLGEWGNNRP